MVGRPCPSMDEKEKTPPNIEHGPAFHTRPALALAAPMLGTVPTCATNFCRLSVRSWVGTYRETDDPNRLPRLPAYYPVPSYMLVFLIYIAVRFNK